MLNNLKSGLVVLGLFLMVGVLTLTFAFTNAKSKSHAPVSTYYNSGNGIYTATPPAAGDECAEPDSYPCSIVLNNEIESTTFPTFIYRGPGNPQNTIPPAAGGVESESSSDRYNLY